nr:aspartate aminotransferase family protein [Nostoc sp. EkiNYC01]
MQPIQNSQNIAVEALSTKTSEIFNKVPVFSSANGCWLLDSNGKHFFDGTGGSGAINLGHQHPKVVEAAIIQLQKLIHTGCKLQSDVRVDLVNKLRKLLPYKQYAVLFTVTGAEAIEAALKVARAYTGRKSIIAFERSYHGKTTGALMATWREQIKAYSIFPSNGVMRSPYPLLHLPHLNIDTEFCLQALKQTIGQAFNYGHPPAAILIEPIQITEGVLPAGVEFLKGVIAIAREAECLIIFDEIYTGFGRCGLPFYCSQQELIPDLLVIGKALGNGFPISTTIGKPSIINALPAGVQTSTFSGHSLACAVSNTVLDVMMETKPWEQAALLGKQIMQFLTSLAEQYSIISFPRGEGLAIGFDCLDVKGNPSPKLTKAFTALALEKGLVLYSGGFEDCTIKLTPPLLMTEKEINFLLSILSQVIVELKLAFG